MRRKTRRISGGVRTEKTRRQRLLNKMKRKSRKRYTMSKPMKIWRNPGTAKNNLQGLNLFNNNSVEENSNINMSLTDTSTDFLRKVIRYLESIVKHSSVNKYTLYAMYIKEKNQVLLEERNIHLESINSDDPFDYIEELIDYIQETIDNSENLNYSGPMVISIGDLANLMEKTIQEAKSDLIEPVELIGLFKKFGL